ncbi:hypothetical protein J6X09_01300 [Candidatus Saccharibacteria bacterium]|nr:hypothetical protein [Candidatus Saccharibacteria bacterium]
MDWVSEKARGMLDLLVKMAHRLGRDPTFTEVDKDPSMPRANDYAYFFGSFTDALREAHRIAFVRDETKPPLPVGKKTIKKEEDTMGRRAITDEEYVIGALRLQKELGHFPTAADIKNDKRCPGLSSYQRRFSTSWVALKDAILSKARELGINEDNCDDYSAPQAKSEWVVPSPDDNPETAPESSEELDAFTESNEELDVVTDPVEGLDAVPEVCTPAEIIDHTKAEIALPSIFSRLSAEPIMSSEVESEGNRLISLYPQMKILSPQVEGYAMVYTANSTVPLNRTVLGIPVSQKQSDLKLVLDGKVVAFPEPQEGIFYIVERKIAVSAKNSGRASYDLLIPEKYDLVTDGTMRIIEFSVL